MMGSKMRSMGDRVVSTFFKKIIFILENQSVNYLVKNSMAMTKLDKYSMVKLMQLMLKWLELSNLVA